MFKVKMHYLVSYFQNNHNQYYENVLFVNDEKLTLDDVYSLKRYIKNLYIVFDNQFSYKLFFCKLKSLSNVYILNSSQVPNILYDIISVYQMTNNIIKFINTQYNLKFIYISSVNSVKIIENQNQKQTQKQTQKQNQKPIKDVKVEIKNIVPQLIKYNDKKINFDIKYGRCDILCLIQNEEDAEFLKKLCKNNSYDYTKYFIFLNDYKNQSLLTVLRMNQINYDIFNFQSEYKNEIINQIFDLISDGEYKINMYDYDFKKDISEILK